jgi:hypothetical protein
MLMRQGTAHKKRFVFLPYGGEAAALIRHRLGATAS